MASSLAVGGLASGIDTKAIIEAQLAVDRAPARLAEKNRTVAQSRLDAVKMMNTKLLALRDALDAVKQKSNYATKLAASSNESAISATAGSSAVAGGLVLNVKKLASAHQLATAGQASATADLGAGSITLRLASAAVSDADITITPTTNTLTGIAEAINGANAGVTASVINDGGASPYRLVVTSTKTGAINAISKLQGSGGFAGVLPNLAGLTEVTAAADAEVRIGDKDTGLLLKSASNLMDQAIPGLSLNLKAVADGVNVTVSQDTASVRAKVQKLVDTYNDAALVYSDNSKYDPATKTSGPLFGEYDLRGRLETIRRELTATDGTLTTGFQSLANVGVLTSTDGRLNFDPSTFDAKLAANQDAVASLFLASGIKAGVPMDNLTRSVDGAMALKQSTLEASIKAFTDRVTTIDARLEKRKAFYQAKFAAMEKIIASTQAQGNSLTAFTNSLSSSKSN